MLGLCGSQQVNRRSKAGEASGREEEPKTDSEKATASGPHPFNPRGSLPAQKHNNAARPGPAQVHPEMVTIRRMSYLLRCSADLERDVDRFMRGKKKNRCGRTRPSEELLPFLPLPTDEGSSPQTRSTKGRAWIVSTSSASILTTWAPLGCTGDRFSTFFSAREKVPNVSTHQKRGNGR